MSKTINITATMSINTAVEFATHRIHDKHDFYVIVNTQFGKVFIDAILSHSKADPYVHNYSHGPWSKVLPNRHNTPWVRDDSINYFLEIPNYSKSKLMKMIIAQGLINIMCDHYMRRPTERNIVDMITAQWVRRYMHISAEDYSELIVREIHPAAGFVGMTGTITNIIRHAVEDIKSDISADWESVQIAANTDYLYINYLDDGHTIDDEFDAVAAEILFIRMKNRTFDTVFPDRDMFARDMKHILDSYNNSGKLGGALPGVIHVMRDMFETAVKVERLNLGDNIKAGVTPAFTPAAEFTEEAKEEKPEA